MSLLENVLAPSAAKKGQPKATGGGLQLYPGDAQKFLKWGSIGFFGFGLYQMALTLAKRNVNPCVEFKDQVEAMNTDPIVRDALIQLQNYRELNPWLFKTALQNIDQLLFLENALLSEQVHPVKRDKEIAFSHFRMGVNRLSQFQFLVRKEMGNEHGLSVNILVKKIYTQLQKHLLNVLHLCSEFRPDNLVARAPLEVNLAMQRMDQGRDVDNSYERWNQLRSRLDEEVASNDRRHRQHRHRHSRRHHHHRRHHSSSAAAESSSEEEEEKEAEAKTKTTVEPTQQDEAPPLAPVSEPTTQ